MTGLCFIFRNGERTFRSVERTYHSAERTYHSVEHKTNTGFTIYYNRLYDVIMIPFLNKLGQSK